MADNVFTAASTQVGADTQEKFVADLFSYLREQHEAGAISDPYPMGNDRAEMYYLNQLSMGEFDDLRSLIWNTANTGSTPALNALWDRFEALSDQWDAALVCKIEPAIDFGERSGKSVVQTYFELNGHSVPGETIFSGTQKQYQDVLYGLEAGKLSLREMRNRELDFEPPEPKFVYKMETDADKQHFVQAFLQTEQQTLVPGPVMFFGSTDICTGLAERLNDGILTQDDFFTESEARESRYTTKDGIELDVLVGPDRKVYMGRHDHHDGHGHYLNADKSLIHITDTYRVFDLISGNTPLTYDELSKTRLFPHKDLLRFIALQFNEPEHREKKSVLAKLTAKLPQQKEYKKSAPKKSAERE